MTRFSTTACPSAPSPQHLIASISKFADLALRPELKPSLTIYPRANRLPILPNQRTCIVVKPDDHPIRSLQLLPSPHHHRMSYVSALDSVDGGYALRSPSLRLFDLVRLLDNDDDPVTDFRVAFHAEIGDTFD